MLNIERVRETIRKNRATSYGLTIVVGLPFPAHICARIGQLQQQIEALVPGRFVWYSPEQCHATVVAPLRGLYRPAPPVQQQELPANLAGFFKALAAFAGQTRPFTLALAGVYLMPNGVVLLSEQTVGQQLAVRLQNFPELDRPKHLRGLSVSIGYLNSPNPVATGQQKQRVAQSLQAMAAASIGQTMVQQLWLVHYANRTLNQVVGKVALPLGRSTCRPVEQWPGELGIA